MTILIFLLSSNCKLVIFLLPKQAKLIASNSPARIDPALLKTRLDLLSKAIVLR
jgi:hypothetical protein